MVEIRGRGEWTHPRSYYLGRRPFGKLTRFTAHTEYLQGCRRVSLAGSKRLREDLHRNNRAISCPFR